LYAISAIEHGEEAPLFGFSAESSRAERQWEEKFKSNSKPENLREYMRRVDGASAQCRLAIDKDNAEWIAAKFKEFGLETQIENFDVLYATPKERLIELVEGAPYSRPRCKSRRYRRPDVKPAKRTVANVQRVFD